MTEGMDWDGGAVNYDLIGVPEDKFPYLIDLDENAAGVRFITNYAALAAFLALPLGHVADAVAGGQVDDLIGVPEDKFPYLIDLDENATYEFAVSVTEKDANPTYESWSGLVNFRVYVRIHKGGPDGDKVVGAVGTDGPAAGRRHAGVPGVWRHGLKSQAKQGS